MEIGKISERILLRSVLKEAKKTEKDLLTGAGEGNDCAVLSLNEEDKIVTSTVYLPALVRKHSSFWLYTLFDNFYAEGAGLEGIEAAILVPVTADESVVKEIMKHLSDECLKSGISILGGHTEVTDSVSDPVVVLTGIGALRKQDNRAENKLSELDVVITGFVGIAGTCILAGEKKEELLKRYSPVFIENAYDMDGFLNKRLPEDLKTPIFYRHDISSGGVFRALWEAAAGAEVGISAELKKIPIKQETVEICNFLDVNPYEMLSGGAQILFTTDGESLVSELEEAGINAVTVGRTNAGKDRVITNDGEVRYLSLPESEALYKALGR